MLSSKLKCDRDRFVNLTRTPSAGGARLGAFNPASKHMSRQAARRAAVVCASGIEGAGASGYAVAGKNLDC
jgi:hypothetical protein